MIHITSLDDGLETFKALGSDTRIQILNILLENEQMSTERACDRAKRQQRRDSHGCTWRKLEECGLINICNESAGHGNSENVFRDAGPHHCGHQETD